MIQDFSLGGGGGGGGGILVSDSISGIVLSVSCVCILILILYLTHTKNYAKADIKYLLHTTMSLSQDIYIYPNVVISF